MSFQKQPTVSFGATITITIAMVLVLICIMAAVVLTAGRA